MLLDCSLVNIGVFYWRFMLKTYEYRLCPNEVQETLIQKHFGCARFIYNWALTLKKQSYENENNKLSCFDLIRALTPLKNNEEYKWLCEVSNSALQQSIRHLDVAFSKFFKKRTSFPKFKNKKNNKKSYSIPSTVKINFNIHKIFLPKFREGINFRLDRTFEGKIKTCTVKQTPTNKYFISILVETAEDIPLKPKVNDKTAIGIDLGIKYFATFSTGEKIENQRNLKKLLPRLKVLQKRASKKKLGSNNRAKANLKVALLHEKIKNRRKDFLHKLSHRLTHDNQVDTLCLETLAVKDMLKNHKLAQSICDVSWREFNRQLDYKSEWYGKNIIRIDRYQPSSKICNCGNIKDDLKLSDRTWTCQGCNTTHDRDILAANNIKNIALKNSGLGKPIELVELSA